MSNNTERPSSEGEIQATHPLGVDTLVEKRDLSTQNVEQMLPITTGEYMHAGWEHAGYDPVTREPIFKWNHYFGVKPEPPFANLRGLRNFRMVESQEAERIVDEWVKGLDDQSDK